jgi:MIP family channel proteins
MMNQQLSREAAAEFIGTFMLILVGAGSVVLAPPGTGAIIPALAHGLILVAIIGTYGHISGAHVNPAVSLAMWIGGKNFSSQKLGIYMLAQFLGSFAACGVLLIVLPTPGQLGQTTAVGDVNELDIILVEGLLTFFLVSVIFQAGVYGKGGVAAPLLIGLTLGACFFLGAPLTGASLNPARMLGPAILGEEMQDLTEILLYLVATFGGGAIAAIVHMDTFKPEEDEAAAARRRKK